MRLTSVGLSLVVVLTSVAHGAGERVLRGHVPAGLARWQRIGRVPATNHLELAIGLPLRNRETLTNLLQQIYDPTSTHYQHYLTPEQFTETFGPTEQDYQAVINFAKAHGLALTGTHPNRMLLDVAASAGEIERALNVRLQVYAHPRESRTIYAPDSEPSLASEVPVLHIRGLNNYTLPHPMNLREATVDRGATATPRSGSGPGGAYRGLDFRAAYVPTTSLTGSGQMVGVFELDGYFASDILGYEHQTGLPNVPLGNVLVDGFSGVPTSSRPGSGNEEVALDIEMVISMAPGLSKVLVYEGPPNVSTAVIDDVLNRMATDNLAKQLSCSWGFDIDATTQQIFQEFAAQGQSFFLASGDSGAFGGPVTQPADDPYVTLVGGTTLTTSASQSWSSETVWSGSGGGISTVYPIPDWQQGVNMSVNQGSTSMRNVPDVAMVADNVWVMADSGRTFAVEGTSIAAPLWAGFTALVNQQAVSTGRPIVGFINPAVYTIGKGPTYTQCFHDITTGNNTSSSNPTQFFATSRYDLCTGWGSPNGSKLINALLAPQSEPLLITPPLGFTAQGPAGGPFSVTLAAYALTNVGSAPLNWTLTSTSAWLNATPTSGTLAPGGGATTVTVTLNSAASNLLIGTYVANVSFTNVNDGIGQNRQFTFLVGNGGFETGDFTSWAFSGDTNVNFADSVDATQMNGSSTIPGVDDSLFVHSGLYGAFLGQNTTLGYLSQSLPTVPGQRYRLSFWLDNPAVGTPNEFLATWNGMTLFRQVDLDQFAWTNLQYMVTATATSTVLEFGFQNDLNAFGLDDISVQPIPAPTIQAVTQAGGSVLVTWSTVAGLSYQAQYTTDLTAIAWQNLGGALTATNTTATASDTISFAQRFYRIVLLP